MKKNHEQVGTTFLKNPEKNLENPEAFFKKS